MGCCRPRCMFAGCAARSHHRTAPAAVRRLGKGVQACQAAIGAHAERPRRPQAPAAPLVRPGCSNLCCCLPAEIGQAAVHSDLLPSNFPPSYFVLHQFSKLVLTIAASRQPLRLVVLALWHSQLPCSGVSVPVLARLSIVAVVVTWNTYSADRACPGGRVRGTRRLGGTAVHLWQRSYITGHEQAASCWAERACPGGRAVSTRRQPQRHPRGCACRAI